MLSIEIPSFNKLDFYQFKLILAFHSFCESYIRSISVKEPLLQKVKESQLCLFISTLELIRRCEGHLYLSLKPI